jgi:hypothetical protein
MDAEFIIVDADDDRLPPFDQIVVLIKACCKNQRTSQRSAEIVADAVSDFAPLAKVAPWPVAALRRRSRSAIIAGGAGDENRPCALIAASGKAAAARCGAATFRMWLRFFC